MSGGMPPGEETPVHTVRIFWVALACTIFAGASSWAEDAVRAVQDYEERLGSIAAELQDIRRELDALAEEVVAPDLGRVFVFLQGPAPSWEAIGVSLAVDGKRVLSRRFSPAELDVLRRGLPLELADLHLEAGEHRVALSGLGETPPEPASLSAERGRLTSWVGRIGDTGVAWDTE